MKLSKSKENFIRYLIIGFSGFCCQIIINKFLSNNINLDYNYSLLIGILSGSFWNFFFFNIFVFKKNKLKNKYLLKGLLKFLFTNLFSLIINYTIALILFNNLKINDIFSQVVAISCTIIFNYFVYTRLIWKTINK
tara:strand:+ start:2308 stop:2715 length:408 start_codon:yes stop_codon:yes gene_type:complete